MAEANEEACSRMGLGGHALRDRAKAYLEAASGAGKVSAELDKLRKEVARLAALPMSVIERARQVLALHETAEHTVTEELSPRTSPMQIQLFEPVNHGIAERIRALKLDELRPIEALQLLSELQQELRR